MGGSRLATGTRRPPARPLPGATWQAHVLDAGAITAELNRLWGKFGTTPRSEPAPIQGQAADDAQPVGVLMRASTLNLIAVGRSHADAERIEDAVARLSDLYPSRATILIADPGRAEETGPGLDVRVALLEQPGDRGRPAVRFESVTVEVSAENERHLASIASPLLVVDLPDFLWWASDSAAGSELFEDLLDVVDRLIVDTAAFADPAVELRHLAALPTRTQGCPKLSDFAWARLGPWRQLVIQFFDPPAMRQALEALDEVAITYGAAGSNGGSGFTGALLFAGWLASCLGWHPPAALVPARGEPGTWRATLRAGSRGRRHEVVLTLRPTRNPLADRSLAEVRLAAHGASTGSFRVERVDPLGLTTWSQAPDVPPVCRMVYAEIPDEPALLTDELRVFARDPVFEAALAQAATLVPDATDAWDA